MTTINNALLDSKFGTLFYDVNGHLILKSNDAHYFLSITNEDELEWLEIFNMDKLLTVHKPDQKNIKNTHEQYSLRKKILDEVDKEEEKEVENCFEEDCENDDKNRFKYNPENKYYYVMNDDDDSESDCEDHVFSNFGNNEIVNCFDKALKYPSIYDLLFFDKTNKLMLKTIEAKDTNAYKVVVMKDEIELNIIGHNRKKYMYEFVESDNEIIPKLIKMETYL